MEARYVAIYKLLGLSKLLGKAEIQDFVALPDINATVKLTINPDPFFFHMDRAAALITMLMRGVFGSTPGTIEEHLAVEIEKVRTERQKSVKNGVFLVFEGTQDVASPHFKARRDTDDFAVCFDAIAKDKTREKFRPALYGALSAISLALPDRIDPRIEKIRDISYLVEAESGKPIYSFTFQGGFVDASVASPLSEDVMERARIRARAFPVDGTLAKVANLLIESQERRTNELRAFVAAWSALEIFVSAMFKNIYEDRWFQIMSSKAPTSTKRYFDRLKSVMKDKHRLVDKFLVIASILDSDAAEKDASALSRLKSVRDGLFHASEGAASRYPVEETQKLLRKYLDLHLAQQDGASFMAKRKSHTRYRDSRTGRFVTEEDAKKHPRTTQKESIPNPGRNASGHDKS